MGSVLSIKAFKENVNRDYININYRDINESYLILSFSKCRRF